MVRTKYWKNKKKFKLERRRVQPPNLEWRDSLAWSMKAVAKKELPIVAFSGRRKAIVAKNNEVNQETASGFNPAEFFQETKEELAKVVWPSRQQVISESLAVLSMVALIASLIYFIDKFFGWAATQVFG